MCTCPIMIFMMHSVKQMMTSLSIYVLLQIKLNKYIKTYNEEEKNYSQQKISSIHIIYNSTNKFY